MAGVDDVDAAPTDIDESTASTVLDGASSSSDVEFVSAAGAPAQQDRMLRIRAAAVGLTQVLWHLQPVGEVDHLGHLIEQVDRLLSRYRQFKIGITHIPVGRWAMYEASQDRVHQSSGLHLAIMAPGCEARL